MKTVTMLEFRRHAKAIFARVAKGESLVLTYRGRPVLRLEPLAESDADVADDDPFYSLARFATPSGETISNEQMDRVVYVG